MFIDGCNFSEKEGRRKRSELCMHIRGIESSSLLSECTGRIVASLFRRIFILYVYLNREKSNRGSVSVGEPLENFVTTEFSQSYSKDHLRDDTGNSKMTRWMCQPDCGNRIPLFWAIMTTIILYLEKSATGSR